MEIARLDLTEPSLNLVHGEGGHWNLETLLERSARIPLAPTGRSKVGARPAFPYIEGTSGRINFKQGPEKKPYALTNADFSLWQESENSWGVRLKAQPFRTDMNLNDTGLLQLTGTWQRADALRDMPLQVNLEWSRAQLGQMTKLVSGNDQGWRGEILLDLALTGTPARLHLAATSSMDDFRRYDITSGKALRMAARCDADYSTDTHDFQQLMCSAPIGDGLLTLTGDAGFPGSHQYSLAASAENVPAAALVNLAQRIKKNLPDDLAAEGILDGKLSVARDGQSPPAWKGAGQITDFHLSSESNKGEFGPETLPFSVASSSALQAKASRPATSRASNGPLLDIGPFAVGGAHPGSATIRGSVDRTAGIVEEVGEGVTSVAPGDRVEFRRFGPTRPSGGRELDGARQWLRLAPTHRHSEVARCPCARAKRWGTRRDRFRGNAIVARRRSCGAPERQCGRHGMDWVRGSATRMWNSGRMSDTLRSEHE